MTTSFRIYKLSMNGPRYMSIGWRTSEDVELSLSFSNREAAEKTMEGLASAGEKHLYLEEDGEPVD